MPTRNRARVEIAVIDDVGKSQVVIEYTNADGTEEYRLRSGHRLDKVAESTFQSIDGRRRFTASRP